VSGRLFGSGLGWAVARNKSIGMGEVMRLTAIYSVVLLSAASCDLCETASVRVLELRDEEVMNEDGTWSKVNAPGPWDEQTKINFFSEEDVSLSRGVWVTFELVRRDLGIDTGSESP